MDRLIYTAMSGAKHILDQQATTAHNIANVNSTGFRAQIDAFRAVPVISEGMPTRAFVVDSTVGTDFTPGNLQPTGRDLDLAIPTKGWFTVQRPDGTQGLTRNGSLHMTEAGLLINSNGYPVMGDGGPITIPPNTQITIGVDGTISAVNTTTTPGPSSILGRIKLVNPPDSALERKVDGLFEMRDGSTPTPDANVRVVGGAVENSNVNVIEQMVNMIDLARQFETQMKLLQNAENNASKAAQLLSLS